MGQIQIAEKRNLADAGDRKQERREKETDRRQKDHQVGAAAQVGNLGLQAPKPEQGGRHEEADEGAQGHHHENQAAGMSQQP